MIVDNLRNIVHKEEIESGVYAVVIEMSNPYMGVWRNGYVAFEKNPFDENVQSYDDEPIYSLDVHGGVTYTKFFDNGVIVGFDTAHAGDSSNDWTVERVLEEIKRMYAQLRDTLNA